MSLRRDRDCLDVECGSMCSLALFPAPLLNRNVTLYESDNKLVTNSRPKSTFSMQEWDALTLHFSRESLKPHSRTESSSKTAFLDHKDTLWMRSAVAWRDGGLTGLLNEIVSSAEEVPKWLRVSSGFLHTVLQWISSFHTSGFPHLTLNAEDMVTEFSQVLDWSECEVRAFDWHPHADKFAVALCDDSIRIINSNSATAPTLKHRLQQNVAALQWKPACASALAVACHTCLLVWHVDPTSLSTRPSSGCAQVLSHPGHSPVTSIAWAPSGSLLVSASPVDTTMLVWDVALESCVPLQRVGGGGVTVLSWAPHGGRLLAATPSDFFRVWETRMWTCDRWPCLNSRCQSACWSPDGSRLLFSLQNEMVIYALTFTDSQSGPKAATVVADVSDTTFLTPEAEITIGGEVHSLAWDPRGERLAVLLKGHRKTKWCPAVIAVFKTRSSPTFQLLPCGFVLRELEVEPRFMQFHPHFQYGALLTVCWSDGKISNVPFYFESGGTALGSPLATVSTLTSDLGPQTLYCDYSAAAAGVDKAML